MTMNVETLLDIVESQLILHGNKRLFIYRESRPLETFSLLAGESSDAPIFECATKHDTSIEEHSLAVLAERLADIDDQALICCSDDQAILTGFSVGFQSLEDGYIETINSTEVLQPTILEV